MARMLGVDLMALAIALPECAAGPTPSSSPSSQSSSSSSSNSSSSSRHSDQDEARDAVRKGRIMPLTAILEIVTKREPGTVMEVDD